MSKGKKEEEEGERKEKQRHKQQQQEEDPYRVTGADHCESQPHRCPLGMRSSSDRRRQFPQRTAGRARALLGYQTSLHLFMATPTSALSLSLSRVETPASSRGGRRPRLLVKTRSTPPRSKPHRRANRHHRTPPPPPPPNVPITITTTTIIISSRDVDWLGTLQMPAATDTSCLPRPCPWRSEVQRGPLNANSPSSHPTAAAVSTDEHLAGSSSQGNAK